MTPPVTRLSVRMLVAVLVQLAVPVSAAEQETCFSRQHQRAIVNVKLALNRTGMHMDARFVQSERDCVLACCSEEVTHGAKCNMAVFKSSKASATDNCYLFHCEVEQDCPLMVAQDGVNTYDIFKGVMHPTTGRPTTTAAPTTTATATQGLTTPPTTTTTTPQPASPTHHTTPTQPPTTMTVTQPTTTTTLTTTTLPSTTTPQPAVTMATSGDTTLPPAATSTTQPTTTTPTTTTPAPPPGIIMATMPMVPLPSATETAAPASPDMTPGQVTESPPASTSAPVTTTTTTSSTPATRKPSKMSRKQNKVPKKAKLHPVTTTTTAFLPVQTSRAPVRAATANRKAGHRTTPRPSLATEPTTTSTTGAVTTVATTTTAATPATTVAATGPYTTRTPTAADPLIVAKAPVQSDHTRQNPVSVESVGQGKAAATRGALRSSLVAVVVLGLASLTLALAVGGRKAMESFDRRHYTRLELNDLHYEV